MKNTLRKIQNALAVLGFRKRSKMLCKSMQRAVQPFRSKAVWSRKCADKDNWLSAESLLTSKLSSEANAIIEPMIHELETLNDIIDTEYTSLQLDIEIADSEIKREENATSAIVNSGKNSFDHEIETIMQERALQEKSLQELKFEWDSQQALHGRSQLNNLIPPFVATLMVPGLNCFDFGMLKEAFDVFGFSPAMQIAFSLSVCGLVAYMSHLVAKLWLRDTARGKTSIGAMGLIFLILGLLMFTGIIRTVGRDEIQHINDINYEPMDFVSALHNGLTWTFFSLSAIGFLLGVMISKCGMDPIPDFQRAYKRYNAGQKKHRRKITDLAAKEHYLRVSFAKSEQRQPKSDNGRNKMLLQRISQYNVMVARAQRIRSYLLHLVKTANDCLEAGINECRTLAGVTGADSIPSLQFQIPLVKAIKVTI